MAILWVRQKPGSDSTVELNNLKGQQSFHTAYTVKSDTATENVSTVLAHPGLPRYCSTHPENPYAVCVKINPVQNKDAPEFWDVSCEWNTNTGNNNPADQQKQPDQRRPKWRGKFIKMPMQRFFDLDGLAFMDKAGTPFHPAPNIPIWVDEITITRYESACDRQADREFLNVTNTDTWNGAEPNTVIFDDIDFEEVFEQGAYWFIYTYRLLVNPKVVLDHGEIVGGWNPCQVLNLGPRAWQPDPDHAGQYSLQAIKDAGVYTGQPAPLDMGGHRLFIKPDGTITDYLGVSLPSLYYLHFRTVNKKAFAPLNLVPPWLS